MELKKNIDHPKQLSWYFTYFSVQKYAEAIGAYTPELEFKHMENSL